MDEASNFLGKYTREQGFRTEENKAAEKAQQEPAEA